MKKRFFIALLIGAFGASAYAMESTATSDFVKKPQSASFMPSGSSELAVNSGVEGLPAKQSFEPWGELPAELKRHVLSFVSQDGHDLKLSNLLNCGLVDKEIKSHVESWSWESIKKYKTSGKKETAHDLFLKAVEARDIKAVQMFIKFGIDINAQDNSKHNKTALYVAVRGQNSEIVKLLIANKVNVDGQIRDGFSPLSAAARENWTDMASLLIASGANLEIVDCYGGGSPLILASLWGHEEMVALLIRSGADPNAQYKKDKTALMLAKERGHSSIVEMLEHRLT